MTALWGPLGWMTLHSVSINYPDSPSDAERQICSRFLDLFTETITCHICKSHFQRMLQTYRVLHPDYLHSKQNFFLFAVRAHNTVNRRLDKPTVKSIAEALTTLQAGLFAAQKIRELEKINTEYWNLRETSYVQFFYEADVLETISEAGVRKTPSGFAPFVGNIPKVGFGGGRLKLRH